MFEIKFIRDLWAAISKHLLFQTYKDFNDIYWCKIFIMLPACVYASNVETSRLPFANVLCDTNLDLGRECERNACGKCAIIYTSRELTE